MKKVLVLFTAVFSFLLSYGQQPVVRGRLVEATENLIPAPDTVRAPQVLGEIRRLGTNLYKSISLSGSHKWDVIGGGTSSGGDSLNVVQLGNDTAYGIVIILPDSLKFRGFINGPGIALSYGPDSSLIITNTGVADPGAMTNPMTTTGDMIFSNPGGTPVRLPIGTASQSIRIVGGVPVYRDTASMSAIFVPDAAYGLFGFSNGNAVIIPLATSTLSGLQSPAHFKKTDSLINKLPGNVTILRNASAFNVDSLNLYSTTYVPTVTGTANVSSVSASQVIVTRVGNVMRVTMNISLTPTTVSTFTTFTITLPKLMESGVLAINGQITAIGEFGIIGEGSGVASASFNVSSTAGNRFMKLWFEYAIK